MSRFKCTFQDDWTKNPNFSWIGEVTGDRSMAYCKLCQSKFSLSNMGVRALTSHQNGKKHKLKQNSVTSSECVQRYFSASKNLIPTDGACAVGNCTNELRPPESSLPLNESSASTSENFNVESQQNRHKINKYLLKENVTQAEIMWCVQAILTHKSLRSAEKDVSCFSRMFVDSEIAKNMQLGRDKMAYIIVHGISPLFKQNLLDEILASEHFVIGFDESINKISQKQQMDLVVRFWQNSENEVKTQYLTSVFLGRTRACDLLEAFTGATKPLDLKRLLQLSMDGPNVNKKFFKELQVSVKTDPDDSEILNIGSCGLHAINVAFKTGAVSTGWKVLEFHRALYYLFKDSPARRSMYTFYSNSVLFPRKFCSVRWLENAEVAQRALDMIPNIKRFIDGVEQDKEAPTCKSYAIVKDAIKDRLFPAKLSFFRTIASEMEGFLREYQTDIPLIPFLYNDLSILMRGLMERFVKKELMVKGNIMNIDLDDTKNFRIAKKIDVGFATQSCLRKIQVSDKEINIFQSACCQFLVKCVKKIKDRSPLTYALTKSVSCFDPTIILDENIFSKRLTMLLLILTEKNWMDGLLAERAKRQFKDIFSRPHVILYLKQYKRYESERIDKFLFRILITEGNYKDAVKVLKIVMVLSHGNANVERGFSINSDCLWENMKEQSLIARRRVYDHVMSKGGISNLEISKQMILYVRNARARYKETIEAQRKEQQEKAAMLKKKREAAFQLKELEAKRAKILQQAQKESNHLEEEIATLRLLQKMT